MTGDMLWPYGIGAGAVDELLGRFLAGLELDRMLSQDAVELLRRAIRQAGALGNPEVGSEHLLIAAGQTEAGRGLLRKAGVEPERVGRAAEGGGEHHGRPGTEQLALSAATKAAMWEADRIAWVTGAWHIRPEHLLLGLASTTESAAGQTLRETELPARLPDRHRRDLTGLAQAGRLSRVIGRDHEIALTAAALARDRKNTPVLVGEPGVGKSAVAEGLARWILSGGVPERLQNTSVVQTDQVALMLDRYRDHAKLILFVHGLDDGRSALEHGEARVVIATTPDRYRAVIEGDRDLEDQLQPVAVAELSVADSVTVLQGVRGEYETQLGVRFDDAALTAAAELAGRYLDGRLPGKAIHLLERAGGRTGPRPEQGPRDVAELEQRVAEAAGGDSTAPTQITSDRIAEVVSGLAGVSLQQLT